MHEHMLPLAALRIAERTADEVRAEPAYQQARLSLAARGFVQPLLYSPTSMTLIDGAHRLVAAQDLGLTEAPVVALTEAEAHLWWAATLLNKERGKTGPEAAQEVVGRLAGYGQLSGVGDGTGEQRPYVHAEDTRREDAPAVGPGR